MNDRKIHHDTFFLYYFKVLNFEYFDQNIFCKFPTIVDRRHLFELFSPIPTILIVFRICLQLLSPYKNDKMFPILLFVILYASFNDLKRNLLKKCLFQKTKSAHENTIHYFQQLSKRQKEYAPCETRTHDLSFTISRAYKSVVQNVYGIELKVFTV